MARYTQAVCRLCRRQGMKLYLKGDRCYSDKCSVDRRNYPPGQHGQRRQKHSDYGEQLREKQKVKRIYGVLEKQFRQYFHTAERKRGITGVNLLLLLEQRLDNMVFRFGFASSRNQSRQLVRHGHFLVNGRKVNIPSFSVKPGDVVELRLKSQKIQGIQESLEAIMRRGVPSWLELDRDHFRGKVLALPAREELTMPIREQLIIELYSK